LNKSRTFGICTLSGYKFGIVAAGLPPVKPFSFALEVDDSMDVDHAWFVVLIDGQASGRLWSARDRKWHWSIYPHLRRTLGSNENYGAEETREAACDAFKAAWGRREAAGASD